MTVTFKPGKRENVPLLIGLDGASGSGKTFCAQLLAAGIAGEIGKAHGREGRVFGIDTERGRMLHYADNFTFMHAELNPPFRPNVYGEAIAAAETAGADVIIVDSFSHEWEGEGGVREWAAEQEAGGKKPPANWMDPKQSHKRLVNKMLAARAHVIVCLRSEEKMRVEAVPQFNDDGSPKMWRDKQSTKMVITPSADLPMLERWVPICEKRFPFEITTSLLLTPSNPGVPIPRKLQEQHRPFFPEGRQITRESGAALARWAMGGAAASSSPDPNGVGGGSDDIVKVRAALEQAAQGGTEALRLFWQRKDVAPFREALAADLERLKPIAAQHEPPVGGQQQEGGYDGA